MTEMKNTVLITGVAGLLGSRLADWIIENKPDTTVIGIDDFSGGYKENINEEDNYWGVKFFKDKFPGEVVRFTSPVFIFE